MLTVIVGLLLATGAPASASPPSNDHINSATVITGLPFRDTLDLSQATHDSSTDPYSWCYGDQQSVWYTYTPTSDERIAFDPEESGGDVAVDVFTGSPGVLEHVGCTVAVDGWSNGLILDASAGATYWIMASLRGEDGVSTLDLSVYPAMVPQATLKVNGGSVDMGGNASITGTLDCVGIVPGRVNVEGSVRQSVGRLSSVSADYVTTATCGQPAGWTALAQPTAGKFVGGTVTVNATAWVCNVVGCARPSTTAVVKLHR